MCGVCSDERYCCAGYCTGAYVCMHVYMYVCTVYVFIYVCVCMYVCIIHVHMCNVCVYIYIYIYVLYMYVYVHVSVYVYAHAYMHACMYVCIMCRILVCFGAVCDTGIIILREKYDFGADSSLDESDWRYICKRVVFYLSSLNE